MAKDIATARPGAKVLGLGAVDVRSQESLATAGAKCVKELGGIDFVMYDPYYLWYLNEEPAWKKKERKKDSL